MKKLISIISFLCLLAPLSLSAQERTVQNRPYTDLRKLHFGVLVGTHLQDIEFVNAGPTVYIDDQGNEVHSMVSTDQSRWDPGFTVGVLAELRLSTHFQFRFAPTLYFGTRHITYRNHTLPDAQGNPTEVSQDMKTAYMAGSCELIFAAPRYNNHRPYLLAGVSPMFNLSGNSGEYMRLKKTDVYLEVGVGCDFYLPFFKLRPELKFMYSIMDTYDSNYANNVKDKNLLPYTLSVNEARTKMIALTFYFE